MWDKARNMIVRLKCRLISRSRKPLDIIYIRTITDETMRHVFEMMRLNGLFE